MRFVILDYFVLFDCCGVLTGLYCFSANMPVAKNCLFFADILERPCALRETSDVRSEGMILNERLLYEGMFMTNVCFVYYIMQQLTLFIDCRDVLTTLW